MGEAVGKYLKEDTKELPNGFLPFHLGQIVQAACLAHDIGNPPFGHSGEAAIKNWFKANTDKIVHLPHECQSDFTKFDGNAMAVRVLVNTGFYGQGMSPTYPVLGALLKYPWPSSYDIGKDKFSYFQTEAEAIKTLADELGLIDFKGRFSRHPLAYLTEVADDICYRIIDMEDATELGILSEEFMFEKFSEILQITPDKNPDQHQRHVERHFRQRNSILRAKLINHAIDESLDTFKVHYDSIMSGQFDHKSSLMEVAEGPISKKIFYVYESIAEKLFLSRRKAVLELGAQNSIGALLQQIMCEVVHFCTRTPSQNKERVKILLGKDLIRNVQEDLVTCPYHAAMVSLDYVTGMSDHYATEMCRKLLGLGF